MEHGTEYFYGEASEIYRIRLQTLDERKWAKTVCMEHVWTVGTKVFQRRTVGRRNRNAGYEGHKPREQECEKERNTKA